MFPILICRMREYPTGQPDHVCRSFTDLAGLSLEEIRRVVDAADPIDPKDKDKEGKHGNHAGRIKRLLDWHCNRDFCAIEIGNGVPFNLDEAMPCFHDGRHRYVAALLRSDSTIYTTFIQDRRYRLPGSVVEYLTGRTKHKP